METVAAKVSDVIEGIAELERLFDPARSEQAARPAPDDHPSAPRA
jgi:hypothetical protein